MTKQKRSKIPYIFFAFFAVVVSVNFFYIYISSKTWRGIVTEDSYHKGLHYNDTIIRVKKQAETGWKAAIKYQKISGLSGEFFIKFLDKNSQPITDADVTVNFKRPTQVGFDFSQKAELNNSLYEAKIIFPLKGQWDVELVAVRGDDAFQEVKRYVIQ